LNGLPTRTYLPEVIIMTKRRKDERDGLDRILSLVLSAVRTLSELLNWFIG
jgi:hypothetical protein